jgi:hypothetical protein
VFIVGGAAMALAYDATFPDEDISPRSAAVLQELFD